MSLQCSASNARSSSRLSVHLLSHPPCRLTKHITIINVNYRVQAWCKSVSSSQGRNPGTKTELFNSIKRVHMHMAPPTLTFVLSVPLPSHQPDYSLWLRSSSNLIMYFTHLPPLCDINCEWGTCCTVAHRSWYIDGNGNQCFQTSSCITIIRNLKSATVADVQLLLQ